MAAGENKNNGQDIKNGQRKVSGSDRNRIKNITNVVHPEYETPRREPGMARRSGQAGSSERDSVKRRTSSDDFTRTDRRQHAGERRRPISQEQAEQMAQARRRRKSAERKRRIIRRRRRQRIMRIGAFCLVLVALVMTVLVVKNYNSGSRHDKKGMTAYENGDYNAAIMEFKEALSYDEQNADYYIHLGMAYIEQKSYDEALGYFNQAEGCTENDEQKALLNRGRGIACLYQGDYAAAVSWFSAALEVPEQSNDGRIDTLYYKAEAEKKSGDYASAVRSYSQIIDLEDDAGARMLRGLAYMSVEDYASAEIDLYAAVKQSRKSYSIYRALYNALMAQGKEAEAQQVLNDALELSGSSGEDYFNRGMIYIDLGDDSNANEMLAQSRDKGYAAALLGLAEVAIKAGDYAQALEDYTLFFNENDPNSIDSALAARAYNQYAVCLMAGGDYEAAAAACENGLKYDDRETDASLSFNLITAYEYLARWEDAYNAAKTYVSKYPDDEQGQREYQFLASRVNTQ